MKKTRKALALNPNLNTKTTQIVMPETKDKGSFIKIIQKLGSMSEQIEQRED